MVQDFPVVHLVPVSRRLFSQIPKHLVFIKGAQFHNRFRNFFRRLNQLSVGGFPEGPLVFRHLLVDVRNLNPLLIPFVSHNRVRAHQPAFRQSILHVAAAHARLQEFFVIVFIQKVIHHAGMLRHVEANPLLFQVSVDYRQPFRRRDIDAADASSVHDNLPNIRRHRPFDVLLEGAHVSEEQGSAEPIDDRVLDSPGIPVPIQGVESIFSRNAPQVGSRRNHRPNEHIDKGQNDANHNTIDGAQKQYA